MLSLVSWIALAAAAAPSSETQAFRSAWAASDFAAACKALDALPHLEATGLAAMAEKARARCAAEAIARGELDQAELHLDDLDMRGLSGAASVAARAALDGNRALLDASNHKLRSALAVAKQLPPEAWPSGLDTALLSAARAALAKDGLADARSTADLLAKRPSPPFGLDELRRSLWWATDGDRVAFEVALFAFLLLLALTMRSLLRTRRRTRALLRTEKMS